MKNKRNMRNAGLFLMVALVWFAMSCAARGQKGATGEQGAPPEAAAAATPAGGNVIQGIEVRSEGDGTSVVVSTAQPTTYTVYKLPNPTRIILDIPDTSIGSGVQTSQAINNNAVSFIQVTAAGEQNNPVTRVVISLANDFEYDVRKTDGQVVLKVITAPVTAAPEVPVAPPPMLGPPMEQPGMEAAGPMPETPLVPEAAPSAALPQPTSGDLPPARKLLDIVTQPEGNLLRVVVIADGSVGSVDAFTLQNPPRIVVDLIGLKSVYPQTRVDVGNANVSSIRVGKHADKTRLVLDLGGQMLPFTTQKRGDQLVITIGQGAETATLPEAAPEAAPAPSAPVIMPVPAPEESEPVPVPMPMPEAPGIEAPAMPTPMPYMEPEAAGPAMGMEAAAPAPAVDLVSVDFDFTAEKSTVRIETSGRAEYEMVTNDRDLLMSIRIKNCTIPSQLERSLDTSEFASPIRMVSSYQWSTGAGKDVYVTLTLNFLPRYYVVREGNAIMFIAENPKSMTTGGGVTIRGGTAEYAAGPSEATEEAEPEAATGPGGAQYYGGVGGSVRRSFSGRVVYLDYQRINVVDALSLLAEVAGLNLVVSGDLKGTVSLKLEAVPWDQALDIILRTQKYGAVIRGNIMRVAPLGELEEEERRFQERRKQRKEEIPVELRIIFISYADPSDVADRLKYILTPGKGKIDIDKRTNSLLIWDIPDNLDKIETLAKRLDIETPQVLIEARIVEARANLSRELGVNWGANFHSGAATGNPTGLNFPGTIDAGVGIVDGSISPGGAPSAALGLGQTAVGIALGSLTNAVDLDLLLRALEIEEKAKVISSPRVLTLDNNQAQISQGVAIPFSTTSASGTKTEFIDANLKIQVTPHVTADRRIIMDVVASNNSPVTVAGAQGPGINKAEATTKILVKDGETAVIGGIFVIEDSDSQTGPPILRKLPFVGWLFRESVTTRNRRELLIFITPRIVSGGPELMQYMRSGQ